MSGRLVVVISVTGLLVAVAVALAVGRSGHPATYSPDQVRSAFSQHGLAISEVSPPDGVDTHGSSYLTPADGAFTVIVTGPDSEARKDFAPYEDDADPKNFQLLDANLIVIADGSNSQDALPAVTRSQIRAAVRSLRESRTSS